MGARSQTLTFTPEEWTCLAVFILMSSWIGLLMGELAHFVAVYVTATWYFDPGSAHLAALCKASWVALRYHFGSLLMAGLVVGLTVPIRLVVGALVSCTRHNYNAVGTICMALCSPCVDSYESILAYVSRSAHLEVVLSSRPFCLAAKRSLKLQRTQDTTVQVLNGVTWLFQVAGVLTIGFLGHSVALFGIMHRQQYMDMTSEMYVHNPALYCMGGAVVAALASMPFMMTLDTVSDTIVYCYTLKSIQAIVSASTEPAGWSDDVLGRLAGCIPCARERPKGRVLHAPGGGPAYVPVQPEEEFEHLTHDGGVTLLADR